MSHVDIVVQESVVEFWHTLFIRQDERCAIRDLSGSTINLQYVYVTGPKNRIVCESDGTVVHGNVSGKT